MDRRLAPILILLLSIALAVSGAFQAQAALRSATLTDMVICAEGGPTHILLDMNGNPAEPGQDCCSCMGCHPVAAQHVPPTVSLSLADADVVQFDLRPEIWRVIPSRNQRPQPRGPPCRSNLHQDLSLAYGGKSPTLEFRQESFALQMPFHGQNPEVFP